MAGRSSLVDTVSVRETPAGHWSERAQKAGTAVVCCGEGRPVFLVLQKRAALLWRSALSIPLSGQGRGGKGNGLQAEGGGV